MDELLIYYMRDNHTFRVLSLNVGQAIEQMRSEWCDGYTHGMLCSRAPGMPPPVHAHGSKRWAEFEAAARAYYAAVPSNAPDQARREASGGMPGSAPTEDL